jgi:hypothetical protein
MSAIEHGRCHLQMRVDSRSRRHDQADPNREIGIIAINYCTDGPPLTLISAMLAPAPPCPGALAGDKPRA